MSVLCSGSYVVDILVPELPHIGPPGSLTYAPKGIHLAPGGHSANVSIDLVQLAVEDVFSTGSIGKDFFGEFMVNELTVKNVKVFPQYQMETATAKNIALIVKGEDRRFIAELTANALLEPGLVKERIRDLTPSVFYQGTIGGLTYLDPALEDVLAVAHSVDAITVVDVIMPRKGWDHVKSAYHEFDILHCNMFEATQLTGIKEPETIMKLFSKNGVKLSIVTDGSKGLMAGTNDFQITMPAFKVHETDPTGAGDALCAGIISRLLEKKVSIHNISEIPEEELIDILLYGQAAGASCVTDLGATGSVTVKNVESLLGEQGGEVVEDTKVVRMSQ